VIRIIAAARSGGGSRVLGRRGEGRGTQWGRRGRREWTGKDLEQLMEKVRAFGIRR